MFEVIIEKINESFSLISGDSSELLQVYNFLKVERPGAYFEQAVKRGFKSPYVYFANKSENGLIVMNGLIPLLSNQNIPEISEFNSSEIEDFLNTISSTLPFKPYDYQHKAIVEILSNDQKSFNKLCTGSGKSIIISLISEFFRLKNKKGILLVPNINLLTQFHEDIKQYNLKDLYENTQLIGAEHSVKNVSELNKSLTISTWQSMANFNGSLDNIDYVIIDECHKFASDVTSEIVQKTINAKFKYGFTGTLPDDNIKKMTLIGLFGNLKTHITTQELIERGLGTPIKIKSIILDYSDDEKKIIKSLKTYQTQLKYLKEHEKRNDFIVNMTRKMNGNTLVLFSHTQHGKELFINLFNKQYPDVKDLILTGKKSFEFQEKYGIYFLNGEDDSKTREMTRKILEMKYVNLTLENGQMIRVLDSEEFVMGSELGDSKIIKIENSPQILIANYTLLSTGVNVRNLHNMILASPLKSYTTISQSIGRGVRLHESKDQFNVYDVVDNLGARKPSGVFWKQYQERLAKSYNSENLPVQEVFVNF